MNGRSPDADRTIDEILEARDGEDTPDAGSGSAAADETLRRLDTEALGLLAYAAEPVEAAPGLRSRVLAAVTAEADRRSGEEGSSPPAESGGGASAHPPRESAGPIPIDPGGGRRAAAEERAGRGAAWSRWGGLVAAVFALAAFGLAAFLWVELDRSRETLTRLVQEQEELTARLAEQTEVQEALVGRADRLSRVMRVASTAGVEICPLRPVGEAPIAPRAFAVLYMPPGQEDWYLVISNLEPAGSGMYKVWIETPEGPVQVAMIGDGDRVDSRMTVRIPPGVLDEQRMLSALVTLEEDRSTTVPSGPMVLFGDEKMQVL